MILNFNPLNNTNENIVYPQIFRNSLANLVAINALVSPFDGEVRKALDTSKWYQYWKSDTSWHEISVPSAGASGLNNIVEDVTPQLGGNLDMNGFSIGGNTEADLDDAVSKKHSNSSDHTRQHAITATNDHTSSATPGKVLKADASGLPIEATNTDSDVADSVSKKHSQNTDTTLIVGDTSVVVTDTGTDGAINLKADNTVKLTVDKDGTKVTNLTAGRITIAGTNKELVNGTNTDIDVADAVSKKHSSGADTSLGAMSADINANSHQITTLSVPDANGEAIRQTAKITEVLLESATDLKHTQNTDTKIIVGNTEVSITDTGSDGTIILKPDGTTELTVDKDGVKVANLTATRVPFVGANKELVDDADLTFATDTLSATKVASSTLTSGKMVKASTSGLLVDATNTDAQVAAAVTSAGNIGLSLVSTQSVTTASSVSFTSLLSTVRYRVVWNYKQITSAGRTTIRFNNDANARYNYENTELGNATHTIGSETAGTSIGTGNNQPQPNGYAFGYCEFQANSALNTSAFCFGDTNFIKTQFYRQVFGGLYTGVAEVTEIDFIPEAGTITGVFTLYKYN